MFRIGRATPAELEKAVCALVPAPVNAEAILALVGSVPSCGEGHSVNSVTTVDSGLSVIWVLFVVLGIRPAAGKPVEEDASGK